jgi:type II secretory pathway component PulC
MKKFFKKLKDKITAKQKERKINNELSDAYDPDDFDEKTGEYELSNVNFDESTGQYDLEEGEESFEEDESFEEEEGFQDESVFTDENLAADGEASSNAEDGETLADLLKRARETEADEVIDDEVEEEEAFEVQELGVSDVKEKYQNEEDDLPDFPGDSQGETPSGMPSDIPTEMPPPPSDFTDADSPSFDTLHEDNEEESDQFAENFLGDEQDNDLDSQGQMPGNLADIPAEFNQDLREHLTAEHELPTPENTVTKKGFKGVFEKLKKRDTYRSLLKNKGKGVSSAKLQDGFSEFFGYNNRPNVHRAFIWMMALGSSAMLGKIIGNALVVTSKSDKNAKTVTPMVQRAKPNKDLRVFSENDLFKTAEHEVDKKNAVVEKPKKKKKVLDLTSTCDVESAKSPSKGGYTLTHTVVLQDSVKSIAAVSIRGSKAPLTLREGDKINGKSRVDHINYQKLILKNLESGECEFLAAAGDKKKKPKTATPYKILPPSQGKKLLENKDMNDNIKNEGNKYAIKKEERTKLLSNLDELLTQALAIQIKNPDGSLSFKLTEIVPGSFYTKIGIQNGDVIKTINGKPITNMNQVMGLFGKISEIDQFQLGVLRNGTLVKKEYNFE